MFSFGLSKLWERILVKGRSLKARRDEQKRRSANVTRRRLQIDNLEQRQLLSLTTLDYNSNTVVAQQGDSLSISGAAARTIASDHDGNFVAVYQRQEAYKDLMTGALVTNQAGATNDSNIYARYFTDQVERITLPNSIIENGTGQFSLVFGGNEGTVQRLTITSGTEPFTGTKAPVTGTFCLSYNGTSTAPIVFNASTAISRATSATNIQVALRAISDAQPDLVGVTVEARDSENYLIHFSNPDVLNIPLLQAATGATFQLGGFYPGVVASYEKQPFVVGPIFVDAANPAHTATLIENAFQAANQLAWDYGPSQVPAGGVGTPQQDISSPAQVRVYPVSATSFDIRFVDQAGKKDLSFKLALGSAGLVQDIYSGAASSNPNSVVDVNGTLYFSAQSGEGRYALYRTYGTADNTYAIRYFGTGEQPAELTMAVVGTGAQQRTLLFFSAATDGAGRTIWKTDGTAAGTVPMTDLTLLLQGVEPTNLTAFNNRLYFMATTSTGQRQLWWTDGTTAAVADAFPAVPPDFAGATVGNFTVVGNRLFFTANNGTNTQLWAHDSATSTTALVQDLTANTAINPTNFMAWNGLLVFTANNAANGTQLWSSDGTNAGTAIIREINPAAGGAITPTNLVAMADINNPAVSWLYFTANEGDTVGKLWRSDGTNAGTTLLTINQLPDALGQPVEPFYNPSNITVFGAQLIFSATRASDGTEPWRLTFNAGAANPTAALIKDVNPGAASSNPSMFTAMAGDVIFRADDGTHGFEPWRTDGSKARTMLAKDINQTPVVGDPTKTLSSNPSQFIISNNNVFYTADDGVHGVELWKSLTLEMPVMAVQQVTDPTKPAGSTRDNVRNGAGRFLTNTAIEITKKPGPEFRVNAAEPDDSITLLPLRYAQTVPQVAMDADGDFVITWQGVVPDYLNPGSMTDIFARRFSPVGYIQDNALKQAPDQNLVQGVRPLGREFLVNTTTPNQQLTPSVAVDDEGNFTIAWANQGQSISFFNGITAQRFDRDGARISNEIPVNTYDTQVHGQPYVGISPNGYTAIAWTMFQNTAPNTTVPNIYAAVYRPNGSPLITPFLVSTGGGATNTNASVAWDNSNQHFLIGWDSTAHDPDFPANLQPNPSTGVYAKEFSFTDSAGPNGTGTIGVNVMRDTFRANSASFNLGTVTNWPRAQLGNQVVMDADGDLTVSYNGFAADASTNVVGMTGTQWWSQWINANRNADLLPYFSTVTDQLPFLRGNVGTNGDVDGCIEQVLVTGRTLGATTEQLGRLRLILEKEAGLLRGDANGAMYSQFDADPTLGAANVLSSDNIANITRDGQNQRALIVLNRDSASGSFVISVNGVQVPITVATVNDIYGKPYAINTGATATAIHNAIETNAANILGRLYTNPPFESVVDVRYVGNLETAAKMDPTAVINPVTLNHATNRATYPWDYLLAGARVDNVAAVNQPATTIQNTTLLPGFSDSNLNPNASPAMQLGMDPLNNTMIPVPATQHSYIFEVTYQGESHDVPIATTLVSSALFQQPLAEIQTLSFNFPNGWNASGNWFYMTMGGVRGTQECSALTLQGAGTTVATRQNAVLTWVSNITQQIYGAGTGIQVLEIGDQNPTANMRQYEVRFGGNYRGLDIGTISSNPDNSNVPPLGTATNIQSPWAATIATNTAVNGAINGQPPVGTAPIVTMQLPGNPGTAQFNVSTAMEPDGDFVSAWTENDANGTGTLYYRRFEEDTDTVGPQVTDFLLPDGSRMANNGTINMPVNWIVVTFDEEMMTDATKPGCVTNLANWAVMRNGVEVPGLLSSVQFGMNKSEDLGLREVGSNKWEAVLTLDGNGLDPDVPAITSGNYQVVLKNTVRDRAGNPLGRTGFNPNGSIVTRSFGVEVPNGGERRANPNPDGTQPEDPTQPQSPHQVCSDGKGNFITVWTSHESNGLVAGNYVYARLYSVTYTDDPIQGRISQETPGMVITVSNRTDWEYAYAGVAATADGDFYVTWAARDPFNPNGTPGNPDAPIGWDVYARRFRADGDPMSNVFVVNTYRKDTQQHPSLAMNADGDLIITWESLGQDGSGYGIYAQRYAPAAETFGRPDTLGGVNEVQTMTFFGGAVGTYTGTFKLSIDDRDPVTDVVTTYTTGPITIAKDDMTFDIATKIETALESIPGKPLSVSAVGINLSQIVITFTGISGSRDQSLLKVVDPQFTPPGASIVMADAVNGTAGEFLVNDTVLGDQTWPDISMSDTGLVVATWTSQGQNGDPPYETNIYMKKLGSNASYRGRSNATAASFLMPTKGSPYRPIENVVTTDNPANHVVSPGTGYDGVAQLDLHRTDGDYVGTGVLLLGGRFLLTAAHNVCDTSGAKVAITVTANFTTPTGTVSIPSRNIYVLPGYNGTPWTGGHDLAIVELQQTAPTSIPRFDIYRNSDEVGKTFIRYGYGLSGQGITGTTLPYGTKRSGQNKYEGVNSRVGDYGDELIYDFDDGTAAHDAFATMIGVADLGLGNNEATAAQGDSGGPNFINNLVAGITSYGAPGPNPISATANACFGWWGADVRVSLYADWIDSITSAGSGEMLVNNKMTANDQKWSSIAMDRNGDFLIAWTSYGQDQIGEGYGGNRNGVEGVFARRYGQDAKPIDANEFQVNTFAAKAQQWPRVAADAAGNFFVTWESYQDRPQPPYATGVDPDSPSSFGIYGQRFARNEDFRAGLPSLGANGRIGNELSINTTKDGAQRWPSVSMDDAGDAVVLWTGNGVDSVDKLPDAQGVYYQRYDNPTDTTSGPIVTGTYDATNTPPSYPVKVFNNDVIHHLVTSFLVTFDKPLTPAVDFDNSVLNTTNWSISKDGLMISGGIVAVVPQTTELPGKIAFRVFFDGDSTQAGANPLTAGTYVLTVSDRVQDTFGNAVDGDYDGLAGTPFHRTFNVLVSGSGGTPDNPYGPTSPGDTGGSDLPINGNTAGAQNGPAVASDARGNFIVVWTTYGQDGDAATEGNIMAQLFSSTGQTIGGEFRVNPYTIGNQSDPAVAMDFEGNFVITWSGEGEIRPGGSGTGVDTYGIYASVYDSQGKIVQLPNNQTYFHVNTFYDGVQRSPSVAMDNNGNFVVAWSSWGQDTALDDGVYFQRFQTVADVPQPIGNETIANLTTKGRQDRPSVAMDGTTNFIIVWMGEAANDTGWGIRGQRFDKNGNRIGASEFKLNTYAINDQAFPQVAMDPKGDFVSVWTSLDQDGSGFGIFGRRYNADGTPGAAVESQINVTSKNWQWNPSVDMDSSGNYTVTWQSMGQDNLPTINYGIYARMYKADGTDYLNPAGVPYGEFRVNRTVTGDQVEPAIAVDSKNNFVVVWTGPDANGTGIWGHLYQVNSTTTTTATTDSQQFAGQATLDVNTLGMYDPATSVFYLRNSLSSGTTTATFGFGNANAGWIPLVGDWNGDGKDTAGLYDPVNAVFYLTNTNSATSPDISFKFGTPGAGWKPIVGDWNGDGKDSVGFYDPRASVFYLRNGLSTGSAQIIVSFGVPGSNWTPVVGDWNGDGIDTVGLMDSKNSTFYLSDSNATGKVTKVYGFGTPGTGYTPITGDWTGVGRDNIGLYNPAAASFYLRNTHTSGAANTAFTYGTPGTAWKPLLGNWSYTVGSAAIVAADGAVNLTSDTPALTNDALKPIVTEAIARWANLGLDQSVLAAMQNVEIRIADLPGAQLGTASGNVILLDPFAAGHGWFVDATPSDDVEFQAAKADGQLTAINAAAIDRIDLLSVVTHELGHIAGLDDLSTANQSLMSGSISKGVRRVAGADEVDAILAKISLLTDK